MAVTIAEIQKLRTMTGAGMMDCKKALAESEGDMEKAIELIRKRGQAIAAKRSDREASEGCVLAGEKDGFAAVLALKCETDFVAKNEDFIALTRTILNHALATRPKNLDELKNSTIDGRTVAELVTDRSGITGEKMELDYYEFLEGGTVTTYVHPGNKLATLVAFKEANAEYETIHEIAMQVAAMNPIAVSEKDVPADYVEKEREIATEKTKAELIQKQVDAALQKAGINPAHVDSEEHIASNIGKGWLTQEQADQFHEIKERVSAEKAASLNENQIMQIAQGRLNKYFQENALMLQEFVDSEDKSNVKASIAKVDKDLTCTGFKRLELGA
mgnify:CR=1 FL=1